MEIEDKRKELLHYINKLNSINELYDSKELTIGYDILTKNKTADHELLYFMNDGRESKGIFVFSHDFFIKELKDRELKKILGHNFLNFRIHNAYLRLIKGRDKKVRINDIINLIANEDPASRNNVLKRILALAYYHGWNLEKVEGIDTDYTVIIPDDFRKRLKQRFNLDMYMNIIDNKEGWFFINIKGDLVFVFKEKNDFSKKDIEKTVSQYIKNEFGIDKISFE